MQDPSFIKTKAKQGKTRRRRITSTPKKRFNVTIGPLDETLLAEFDSFFADDCEGGSLNFDWVNPLTRTAAVCAFDSDPQAVPVTSGGTTSQTEVHVSFILEIVSE